MYCRLDCDLSRAVLAASRLPKAEALRASVDGSPGVPLYEFWVSFNFCPAMMTSALAAEIWSAVPRGKFRLFRAVWALSIAVWATMTAFCRVGRFVLLFFKSSRACWSVDKFCWDWMILLGRLAGSRLARMSLALTMSPTLTFTLPTLPLACQVTLPLWLVRTNPVAEIVVSIFSLCRRVKVYWDKAEAAEFDGAMYAGK